MNAILGIWPRADGRVDYLMALRGAAVTGVVLGHLFGIGGLSIGAIVTKSQGGSYQFHTERFELWRSFVEVLTPLIGTNFVMLFFVQSGYLMGKVFYEGRHDAMNGKGEFYSARFLRLAPLLYFNLLVCLGLFSGAEIRPIEVIGDFLFITNFTDRGINLVTWSLSHEMQYYLICPFVFLLFRKASRADLFGIIILIGVAFLLPVYVWPFGHFTYLHAFLAGFAVNIVLRRLKPALSDRIKQVGLLIGLLIFHLTFNALYLFGYYATALASSVIISSALVVLSEAATPERQAATPLILRVGMLFGYLTYGIYLWHYVIIRTRAGQIEGVAQRIAVALDLKPWETVLVFHSLELVVVGSLSLALAFISYVCIETKFRPNLYSDVRARSA
jgi:peptidoglycan/LPS O-acetylase OafA/YrhL